MGALLNMQLSAFIDKKIIPSTENIAVIMPKLKEISGVDLLPNVMYTQKIDVSNGIVENVPNLSFSSINNINQVICTDNRIDCLFGFDMNKQDGIESSFESISRIIGFIMGSGHMCANRLALNVNYVSDVCSGRSLFETQIMHMVPFYQNRTIKEWSSRTNAIGHMNIYDCDEELNIIAEYTHATHPENGEMRVKCHVDINTIAENKDYRFKHDSIEQFETQARELFEGIKNDLESLVSNDV